MWAASGRATVVAAPAPTRSDSETSPNARVRKASHADVARAAVARWERCDPACPSRRRRAPSRSRWRAPVQSPRRRATAATTGPGGAVPRRRPRSTEDDPRAARPWPTARRGVAPRTPAAAGAPREDGPRARARRVRRSYGGLLERLEQRVPGPRDQRVDGALGCARSSRRSHASGTRRRSGASTPHGGRPRGDRGHRAHDLRRASPGAQRAQPLAPRPGAGPPSGGRAASGRSRGSESP